MKILLTLITVFLFVGCTTMKPHVTEFRVITKDTHIKSISKGCKENSLKISQAFSSASLLSLNMDYTESDNQIFSYSQAQWQESPNSFITSALYKSIRDSALFKSVHSFKSRVKSDFVLEIDVEEFMQFYTKDMSSSYVNVIISLSLVDAKTNTVVKANKFSSKIDTKTQDADGGVEALSLALDEIISKNIEWLEGECK
ncbi:MAG: ABC-type transport auxiliary lipoprotein family protein [Sulfurimonas sp.]|jgi:cholesterol transport system auxiliary component|uniref:ABC-type transport auxiliary lipoprotein family protein n=1 Tax=Sulfurimonas sp. TaxID=2022749 RepID=UPI002604CE99|nr:ABC-type transport auxiliary lipoprotein family protein [Sulfurimonas sp.]MDD3475879.1 ABC-type transport auxiliary lipoprotein family protein [Sulfurimonas sp.]